MTSEERLEMDEAQRMSSQIAMLLAWLDDGLLTESDVVQWADRQIASALAAKSLPDWLLELSLRGPEECRRRREIDLPAPAELSFAERLAGRAERVDLRDYDGVLALAWWASRHCMGGNLEDEAVSFGYQLDHLLDDCQLPDRAVEFVRECLPGLPSVADTPGSWGWRLG